MVGFVLEDDGGEAGDCFADFLKGGRILVRNDGVGPARYSTTFARDRKATFLTISHRSEKGIHTDVGIHLERFVILIEPLDSDDAAADPDLRTSYPDSILARIGNGTDHLAGQSPEFLRTQILVREVLGRLAEEKGIVPVLNCQHTHQIRRGANKFPLGLAQGRTGRTTDKCKKQEKQR